MTCPSPSRIAKIIRDHPLINASVAYMCCDTDKLEYVQRSLPDATRCWFYWLLEGALPPTKRVHGHRYRHYVWIYGGGNLHSYSFTTPASHQMKDIGCILFHYISIISQKIPIVSPSYTQFINIVIDHPLQQVSDFLEMEGAPEPHHVLLQKGLLHQWKPGWLVSNILIAFWCHQTWLAGKVGNINYKGVIFQATWDDLNYIFVSFFGLNQSQNWKGTSRGRPCIRSRNMLA